MRTYYLCVDKKEKLFFKPLVSSLVTQMCYQNSTPRGAAWIILVLNYLFQLLKLLKINYGTCY